MASNSETGHAVNISNFKLLIDRCTALGASYNPSNTDLTIANMTTLWSNCDAAHKTLTTAVQTSKNPINERQILFKPVDKLVTKTLNYFRSTKASAQIKADAKGLGDRYRGFNVKVKKLSDGTPDPDDVSNSHLSYVQKCDIFQQLVTLYSSDTNYAPNEAELKTGALSTLAADMKKANDNIGTIISPVGAARIARDKGIYGAETGIVDVAQACKDYVKGLFGPKAPETKSIVTIKFKRV